MSKRAPTISIGISAYNEETNIGNLLNDLIRQKEKGFKIREIVIRSDGSTDHTVDEIKKVRISKIKTIKGRKRVGKGEGLNKMMKRFKGDVVVLLDADISIKDPLFLSKLTFPVINCGVDLTSSDVEPIKPKNLLEKILWVGVTYKQNVFKRLNRGINWFTCKGVARCFSLKFIKRFRFKVSVGEDMFSYFYCVNSNLKYEFAREAVAFYKLPSTIQDHRSQSLRFLNSQELMKRIFGRQFIDNNCIWPIQLFLFEGIKTILLHPVLSILYALLVAYMNLNALFNGKRMSSQVWSMAKTTRGVSYDQ